MAKRVVIVGADGSALTLLRKALGRIPSDLPAARRAALQELGIDIEELNVRLQRHLSEYLSGERTRGSVEWWMKREIRYFYRHAYLEGLRSAGNYRPLDEWGDKTLVRLRRDEYRYLRQFLDDVDARAGVMNYRRRMRMYADALSGVYWLAFVRANRSSRRRIRWVRTPAESCPTCVKLDGRKWTPQDFLRWYKRFGILPGKGTQCLSNCKCRLEDYYV